MPSPNTGSPVANVVRSGNTLIDALLIGTRWAGAITYSFADANSVWSTDTYTGYPSGASEPYFGFSPLSSSDRSFFATAVQKWTAVANIPITMTFDSSAFVGDIRTAYTVGVGPTADAQAWAFPPASGPAAGDVWFNSDSTSGTQEWTPGSYPNVTVIHELGHALGLKHPFEDGVILQPTAWDSMTYTIMSYTAEPGMPNSYMTFYPTTPMVLDIQAIQYIYGANRTYHSGADTYVYNDSTRYHETIWDGGGTDAIRYDGSRPTQIDLQEGHGSIIGQPVYTSFSFSRPIQNVWIAFGASIENAVGGQGADVVVGNSLDNDLDGRSGSDTISGREGSDRLTGGSGNDVLDGGSGTDKAVYAGPRSSYSIAGAAAGYTVQALTGLDGLDTLIGIERVEFSSSSVALDMGVDQPGGESALLLGATLGNSLMRAKLPLLGTGIGLFEQGYSFQQLSGAVMRLPIWDTLTGQPQASNSDIAGYLLSTVIGHAPDAAVLNAAVAALDTETGLAQGNFLASLAASATNQVQIDLAGLQQTGLEFA
jgi:serralysin